MSSSGATPSMRDAWEEAARKWIAWARKPGFDSYWRFHRDQFLEIVPQPGRLTLDVGCGEGRLSRDLKARGHRVVGVDGSKTLVEAAREADPSIDVHHADAAKLPFDDAYADLVVAFMSLHDVDDLSGALRAIARVLEPRGRLCIAIVHPLNSAGNFASDGPNAPFMIAGSYLDARRYTDSLEREGLSMTFSSEHRSIDMYSRALEDTGFVIEAIREHKSPAGTARAHGWDRIPLFLHLRARRI
jgi:SAM-dependent methyltransferase